MTSFSVCLSLSYFSDFPETLTSWHISPYIIPGKEKKIEGHSHYQHVFKNPHDSISFEAVRYFANLFYGGQIPVLYIKQTHSLPKCCGSLIQVDLFCVFPPNVMLLDTLN